MSTPLITAQMIRALNPCRSRFHNYIQHYGKDASHRLTQFMGLKNITHEDKLWVAIRLMREDDRRLFAADCAESVLHLYESEYPGDMRPRNVIEAARTGVNVQEARRDANAAAYAAYDAAAYDAAAYVAADAATYVAAAEATFAATYAATYAARAAANAGKNGEQRKAAQEKLIRKIAMKYVRKSLREDLKK